MVGHTSPEQLKRSHRSQHLALDHLLLEQPAQQDHLGLEGPELRWALERSAIKDLPAAAMKRWRTANTGQRGRRQHGGRDRQRPGRLSVHQALPSISGR